MTVLITPQKLSPLPLLLMIEELPKPLHIERLKRIKTMMRW